MKNFFAHVISIIFQPLLLPLYGTLYAIYSNPYAFPDELENYQFIARVAINTFFFPALVIALLVALRFAGSVSLRGREERVVPYIAAGLFYIWIFYVFYKEGFNSVITFILLGSTIAVFIAFLSNILFMKISMHTTGGGGLIAMLLVLIPFSQKNALMFFLVAILIAGLIGSSRLILKAHTEREIYYGYLAGFFSFLLAYNIYLG